MTEDTTLTLRRVLNAPRPLVWRCLTEPELLKRWFCPRPHYLTDVKVDLRPGGIWWIAMFVDGATPDYESSVLEVVPERRLVITDLLVRDFQPVEHPFLGYTAAWDLSDDGDRTIYHVTARHRTAKSAARHEKMGFTEGWGTCADQLDELAAGMAAAAN